MSDIETNRALVTRAFEAWQQGEGYIGELFADRMTWRIENSSLAPGSAGETVIGLFDGRGVASDGIACENTYASVPADGQGLCTRLKP